MRFGQGRVWIYPLNEKGQPEEPLRFSDDLHCADCDIHGAAASCAITCPDPAHTAKC